MFVRDEVRLDVGFEEAWDRLAKLDSWFLTASDDAYGDGITSLDRIGPLGPAPGISRLAEMRFPSLGAQKDCAGFALRREVRGVQAVIHLSSLVGVWRPLEVYHGVNVTGTNIRRAALSES